jgi:hypothetical protein
LRLAKRVWGLWARLILYLDSHLPGTWPWEIRAVLLTCYLTVMTTLGFGIIWMLLK